MWRDRWVALGVIGAALACLSCLTPFAVVTLGIVWFFVALLMLWLTDLIVPKFSIHGFWTYVWATIIVWVVNIVVDAILSPRRSRRSRAAVSAA